jgi:hypothetical protein
LLQLLLLALLSSAAVQDAGSGISAASHSADPSSVLLVGALSCSSPSVWVAFSLEANRGTPAVLHSKVKQGGAR